MRRPTKYSEDFVYTPLVMHRQRTNNALKLKQKSIIKQQEIQAEKKCLFFKIFCIFFS
jgi:hypothetical protein